MKLNVCCGKRILQGYVNIDVVSNPAGKPQPERVAPANSLPIKDGMVEELMCIHGWEHFYRWECDTIIAEWKRVLKPDGLLVLELPDLKKCAQNFVAGLASGSHPDQLHMWGIYGDATLMNPHMIHKWGWTPETLETFLRQNGFGQIRHLPTVWHPAGRAHRDMRIEATRI